MSLRILHLRVHLLPQQTLRLPAYNKGNALRGGFGGAFRRLVCVDLRWECGECTLRYSCPYTKVFNPFIPPGATQFSGNRNIPRPFVIKPPLTVQTQFAIGEAIVFDLILIGSAVEYLAYFIVTLRELGTGGFGLNRARVELSCVEAIGLDGAAAGVYEATTNRVTPGKPFELEVDLDGDQDEPSGKQSDHTSSGREQPQPVASEVTLEFLTPTTLKAGSTLERGGDIVRHPAFHHIVKRLRDRVNALATFYGDGPLDLDFKGLGQAAERVETVDDQTRWVERTRYSRRRDVSHDLSGFTGSVTFRGDIAPFLPLLRVGEHVHVGKNAVFGNGWMRIAKPVEGGP
jgi:hypothetical protein